MINRKKEFTARITYFNGNAFRGDVNTTEFKGSKKQVIAFARKYREAEKNGIISILDVRMKKVGD